MKKTALIFSTLLIVFLVACEDDDSNSNKNESQPVNETADESNDGSDNQSASENEAEQDVDTAENESEENNATDNEDKTLDGLVKHFEDAGFDIGEKTEKVPEMIGASEGFGIEVDGEDVEFYQYEPDSEELENAQTNEEVEMEDFGSFPALANGSLVMISHDEHSEEAEIVDVFENF